MPIRSMSNAISVTAAQLRRLESHFAHKLPLQYRRFLGSPGAGVPTPNAFRIHWKQNPCGEVERFYQPTEIIRVTRTLRTAHAIPTDCICIGTNAVGDELLLAISGSRRGIVFYWDSRNTAGGPGARVHLVARSFAAFLERIADSDRLAESTRIAGLRRDHWGEPIPRFRRRKGVPMATVARRGDVPLQTRLGWVNFQGTKLSKRRLRLLEKTWRARLPTDYRAFLLECNGGHPLADVLTYKIGRRRVHDLVAQLYGIGGRNHAARIEKWHEHLRAEIPNDCIPIGSVAGEDQLLLAIKGRRRGTVLMWSAWGRARDAEKRVRFVAPSFGEFAKQLSNGSKL